MAKSTQLVEYLSVRSADRQAQEGPRGFLASAGMAFVLAGAVLIAAQIQSSPAVAPEPAAADWADFASTGPAQVVPRKDPAERDQRALTEFIAKRFRVARDAAGGFVAAAFQAGAEHRVDPLLVLAVVAVESRFNPVAESSQGAMGLMQVLPKYHQDKLLEHGGDAALLDPVLNIAIGTRILRDYLRRAGETESGLQMYGGAFDEPSAQYAGKVLLERTRLEQFLARARRADV